MNLSLSRKCLAPCATCWPYQVTQRSSLLYSDTGRAALTEVARGLVGWWWGVWAGHIVCVFCVFLCAGSGEDLLFWELFLLRITQDQCECFFFIIFFIHMGMGIFTWEFSHRVRDHVCLTTTLTIIPALVSLWEKGSENWCTATPRCCWWLAPWEKDVLHKQQWSRTRPQTTIGKCDHDPCQVTRIAIFFFQ